MTLSGTNGSVDPEQDDNSISLGDRLLTSPIEYPWTQPLTEAWIVATHFEGLDILKKDNDDDCPDCSVSNIAIVILTSI